MPKKKSPPPSPEMLANFKKWGSAKSKKRYDKRVNRPRLRRIYGNANMRLELDGVSRPFGSYAKAFRWVKTRIEPIADMDEIEFMAHLTKLGVEVYGGRAHALRSMAEIGMIKLTILKVRKSKPKPRPTRVLDVEFEHRDFKRKFRCNTRLDIYTSVRSILFPTVQPSDVTYKFALSSVLDMPVPRDAAPEDVIDLLVSRRVIRIRERIANGKQ